MAVTSSKRIGGKRATATMGGGGYGGRKAKQGQQHALRGQEHGTAAMVVVALVWARVRGGRGRGVAVTGNTHMS